MMKKMIALVCAAAVTITVLTGCGAPAEQKTSSQTEAKAIPSVKERTTFTLGFDASFPPYGFLDEQGEYVGFDLDLAAEVCKRLGWELVKQPVDWDSKDMELSSGSIDCIWNGFTMSEDRVDKYSWSAPYVDNSQVFVVAKESGIKKQKDLAGKAVAVQKDSSALEALSKEEGAKLAETFSELLQVAEYNTAFMNLESGAVDAVAMDVGVAKYQLESRGDAYEIMEEKLATEVYAIGYRLGDTELRDAVQMQLDDMAKDGTFMEIAEKWDLADSVTLGK